MKAAAIKGRISNGECLIQYLRNIRSLIPAGECGTHLLNLRERYPEFPPPADFLCGDPKAGIRLGDSWQDKVKKELVALSRHLQHLERQEAREARNPQYIGGVRKVKMVKMKPQVFHAVTVNRKALG